MEKLTLWAPTVTFLLNRTISAWFYSTRVLLGHPVAKVYVVATVLQSAASSWFFSTYVLFLLQHGLNFLGSNSINFVFMLSSAILDPLTGNLADRFGVKRIYLAGQVVWGLGMLVYGLSDLVWLFIIAEMVGSLGKCLMSQTLESWLQNECEEETFHQTMACAAGFAQLARIPAAVGGAFVGTAFGLHWPWLLTAVSSMLAAVLVFLLSRHVPDIYKGREQEKLPNVLEVFNQMKGIPALRLTVIVNFGIAMAYQAFNMFWAPIFQDMAGATWWFPFVWVGIAVTAWIGALLAGRLVGQIHGSAIAGVLLSIGGPMVLSPFLPETGVVLVFFAHQIGREALGTILSTYSGRYMDKEVRATSKSICSAAIPLGSAAGLAVSGVLTLWVSPLAVWGISAAGLLLLAVYVYLRRKD